MAEDKERVSYVRYVFSASDNLFANEDDLSICNVPKSIDTYIRLCQDKLRQVYPNTGGNVDVIDSDDDASASGTYVDFWDTLDDASASNEIENVTKICNDVFNQGRWYEWESLVFILDVKNRVELPASIIRWVMAKNLIDTKKSANLWRFQPDDIHKISKFVTFVTDKVQLKGSSHQGVPIACYLEDMRKVPLAMLPEDTDVLVASRDGFDGDLFLADSSLFHLYKMGEQVDVTAEHFVNVVKWSGWKWSYPIFVNALEEQAERKEIICKIQLSDQQDDQDIDGISFQISRNISPEITLQEFIEEALAVLSETVSNTKLSLNGGPVWDDKADKIYQKYEIPFCEEVLLKLLKKMEFEVVRYTHGGEEYGRDFIFKERTPFFQSRYYGLQAKKGDIGGGANSLIDKILSQIENAFVMPYAEPGGPDVYIDTMIIATSGKFAPNAIKKIRHSVPQRLKGSLFFWDKEIIQFLISQYWK